MKSRKWVFTLVVVFCVGLFVAFCLSDLIVSYNTIKVENVQVYRQLEMVDTGEVDGEGNPIFEQQLIWRLAINYTLTGDAQKSGVQIFPLTTQQQAQVVVFLKPFVKVLKEDLTITQGEVWADE